MRLGITKEYHYQKLALESRNVCHTLIYLATLLHSNNAKDVKELMPYTGPKLGNTCPPEIIFRGPDVQEGLHAFRRPIFPKNPDCTFCDMVWGPHIARWASPLRAPPPPIGGCGGASFGSGPIYEKMLQKFLLC